LLRGVIRVIDIRLLKQAFSSRFVFPVTVRPDRSMQIIIVVLGLTTMVLQVTALRELVTVFAGNELDLGITLAVWLLAVGTGSAAGRRLRSSAAFGTVVLLVGLLAQPLLSFAPFLRPLLSLELGETIPLGWTIISTVLLLAPFCIPAGMQFPLAVAALGGQAAEAYLLEAAGALLGGLLSTFVLAGRAPAAYLLAGISMVHVLLGAALLGRKRLVLLLLIPLSVGALFSNIHRSVHGEDQELVSRKESRYGLIEVYGSRDQFNIFAAGKFQYAYPDPQTEELTIHLPFSLHSAVQRVLLIGGSPAAVREALKHRVAAVDFVELDPELVRTAEGLLELQDRAALADPRVTVITTDARRYLKAFAGSRYDLIIMNLPEPSTANVNRCYTVEFFREAKRAMQDDGVITLSLPLAFGYMGRHLQMANGAVYRSLAAVFRYTALSSEEYGLLAGSERPIGTEVAALTERFLADGVDATHFHPFTLQDAFSPLRTNSYRQRLEKVDQVNTDKRPAAYLFSILVWADMQRNGILAFLVDQSALVVAVLLAFAVIAAIFLRIAGRAVSYTVLTTGVSSMALSLVVLLAYQSSYGYVYARVGMLTASFMAGNALGAYGCRNVRSPLRLLRMLEGGSTLLLLSAPWLFRHELVFVLVVMLAGAIGGAVFATAATMAQRRGIAGSAGGLYALDLAGSFFGALAVALFLVPVLGMQRTLLVVLFVKILSLSALFTMRRENA
jgi:spermidine synthase